MGVRQGGPLPGGDNRIESGPVRAQAAHTIFDLSGQVDFGHRGLEMAQRLVQRLRIQPDRILDGVNFAGGLYHAQRLDGAGEGS